MAKYWDGHRSGYNDQKALAALRLTRAAERERRRQQLQPSQIEQANCSPLPDGQQSSVPAETSQLSTGQSVDKQPIAAAALPSG